MTYLPNVLRVLFTVHFVLSVFKFHVVEAVLNNKGTNILNSKYSNSYNDAAYQTCRESPGGGVSEVCTETLLDFTDEDVSINDFQFPRDYDLDEAVYAITEGSGYYLLKGMFTKRDVEIARDRVLFYENPYGGDEDSEFKKNAENHNNYEGLLWALLNKGRIFEKFAQHPVILEIARKVLGPNCLISSLAANTVLPGMMAQTPHLDYPYYDYLFPNETNSMNTNSLLAVQFVTLLTNFTKENGGTAIRPYSHLVPNYPTDEQEFFKHAIQVEAEAGDTIVFAGPIQHCAMANKSKTFRSGILQHMVPIYIRPFEDIVVRPEVEERANSDMRKILGLDHPYPTRKG